MAKKIVAPVTSNPVAITLAPDMNPIEAMKIGMNQQIEAIFARIQDKQEAAQNMENEARDLASKASALMEQVKAIKNEIKPDEAAIQQLQAAIQAMDKTPKGNANPSAGDREGYRYPKLPADWFKSLVGKEFSAADVAEVTGRPVENVRALINKAKDAGLFVKVEHGVYKINTESDLAKV